MDIYLLSIELKDNSCLFIDPKRVWVVCKCKWCTYWLHYFVRRQSIIKPQRLQRRLHTSQTFFVSWSLTKISLAVSRKSHFITSQVPPSRVQHSACQVLKLERWAGNHSNSPVRKKIMLGRKSQRGRDRFHQDRVVTLHPALHIACIKRSREGGHNNNNNSNKRIMEIHTDLEE